MRWFNVVLAVLILTMPLLAGDGNGSRLGFNPTKFQVQQTMNQTQSEPPSEPMPGDQIEGKLVPGKALLLSAILPGAGQFYAKNYIMSGVFLALEVGAWTGVAMYHSKGMDKEDQYLAYADDHWTYGDPGSGGPYDNYFEYEYWCANQWGYYKDGTESGLFTGTDVEWKELTWNEKLNYLPKDGFTHELDPTEKDQQYYEEIGKYNQFATGWDDYTEADYPFYDDWKANKTITPHRDYYLTLRKDSNDALDMSKNFTMVVMGNHLLAALHAGFSVTWHNRKLAQEQNVEGAFNVQPKMYNNEMVTMGTLTVKF